MTEPQTKGQGKGSTGEESEEPGIRGCMRYGPLRPDPDHYALRNAYLSVQYKSVIFGYRDKRTQDFAAGRRVKGFSGIERAARLKLDRLEAAVTLRDLSALPGNRFEALKGDRKGQYSIRINDQFRICFEWQDSTPGPSNVEIVDYH